MSITAGAVLYGMIWFLTLFVLLPIGIRSQDDMGEVVPGTHASAPHATLLKKKVLWATLIATLIWAVVAWLIIGDILTRADVETWDRVFRR